MAREIVLRQLAVAPRTRAQLTAALLRRQIPEEVAERVLDRFEEVDLVDDAAFAEQWVRSRHATRGAGRRLLAQELRQRGVDDEVVRSAVAEVSPEDELEAARHLVRRKVTVTAGDDRVRRIRRLSGMLARRGYGGEIAARAIREVLGEVDDVPGEVDDVPGEVGAGD